jgi:hypothetical protein
MTHTTLRAHWAATSLSAVAALVLATLAACGGGGSSADSVPLPPPSETATAASYTVRDFNFVDTGNYALRYYYSDNVADSAGLYTYYDVREALGNGKPAVVVYSTNRYVTASGWHTPLNGATPNTNTGGASSNYTYNYGYTGQSARTDSDVSGQSIASVVALAQDLSVNTSSTLNGVSAAGLSGTMPAGAKVRKIVNTDLSTPVGYDPTDGTVGNGVTSLATLVTAFPVPAAGTTITTSNSVTMGGLHGTAGCGTTVCLQERMRVAFGGGTSVTYYLCDVNTSTSVQSNCTVAGTGSFANSIAADGTTPIMSFSGLPSAASVQTFSRVFVQLSGKVYFGFQDKLTTSTQTRLNKVAFEALSTALGITPPSISAHPVSAGGVWSVSYVGGDTGNCAAMTVNAAGHVIGTCTSTGLGGSFIVSGTAAADGSLTLGSTSSDASFSGSFGATTGSGPWHSTSLSVSGTWTATRQ